MIYFNLVRYQLQPEGALYFKCFFTFEFCLKNILSFLFSCFWGKNGKHPFAF